LKAASTNGFIMRTNETKNGKAADQNFGLLGI